MVKINHYGHTVDSEIPITGVVSNNSAEWLPEDILSGIDLNFQEHVQECDECQEGELCKVAENWESFSGNVLVGGWKLVDGKYEPDKDSPHRYAGIVRETETQVVWSKYTARVNLCSPCFPGQGDLDSSGNYLAYDLPPDVYGSFRDVRDYEDASSETSELRQDLLG